MHCLLLLSSRRWVSALSGSVRGRTSELMLSKGVLTRGQMGKVIPVHDEDGPTKLDVIDALDAEIRRALQPYQRGKQVALVGAIWLVTANNA
jgi:hypothetical protein